MKKALSSALVLVSLLSASATFADTAATTETTVAPATTTTTAPAPKMEDDKKPRQEIREIRQDAREEKKDKRQEFRTATKDLRASCKTQVEAATTEVDKVKIRTECESKIKVSRAELRANIVTINADRYAKVKEVVAKRIAAQIEKIKALPADKKAAAVTRLEEAIDKMLEKAEDKGRDQTVLTLEALKETLKSI